MCTKHYYFLFDGGKIYCSIENEQNNTVSITGSAPTCGSDFVLTVFARVEQELKYQSIYLPSQVQLIYYNGYHDSKVGYYTITSIGREAFKDCGMLHEITIPSSVTSVSKDAFAGCSNLKTVNMTSAIKQVELSAFNGCENLKEINVIGTTEPTNGSIYSSFDGILCQNGKVIYVPNKFNKNTLDIPSWVNAINANVFSNRQQLNSVKMLGVQEIGDGAFKRCENLKEVVLGKTLKTIGERAFEDCDELEQINLPSSLAVIKKRAFLNCISISSVAFSDVLAEIGSSAFENCVSLRAIIFPKSIKCIGENAFKNCSELTSITFPESVNGLRELSNGVFSFCSKLNVLKLPLGLKCIDTNAFLGCTSLERVVVNDDILSIGRYAFMGCANLYTINIPKNAKIYDETFIDCPKLKR